MERCWEETPVERLTFPKIKDRLKRVIGDVGDNIVDLLFKRMEQYAADLEFKVAREDTAIHGGKITLGAIVRSIAAQVRSDCVRFGMIILKSWPLFSHFEDW